MKAQGFTIWTEGVAVVQGAVLRTKVYWVGRLFVAEGAAAFLAFTGNLYYPNR